jgi:amino-acid N-acetyltransferase
VTTPVLDHHDVRARPVGTSPRLRRATADDADAIHGLIARHQAEGHLLPRTTEEVRRHAVRFVVAIDARGVAGCAELMPFGNGVAEIRSLVVEDRARGFGLGRLLVEALVLEARQSGALRLCAFTHEPGFFARLGFSLVPHAWLPEKVAADCAGCPLFRRCGQAAMELRLAGHAGAVDIRQVA